MLQERLQNDEVNEGSMKEENDIELDIGNSEEICTNSSMY